MKILCIGRAYYNTTFKIDVLPKETTKTTFHDKIESTGGFVTASFLLSKWYDEVEFAGVIANDEYGRKIKKECILNRVGVKYLIEKEGNTAHGFTLSNNLSNTVYEYSDKSLILDKFQLEEKPNIILIDSSEYEASTNIIKNNPKVVSIMTIAKETKEALELSKMVNYLICPLELAENITKIKTNYDDKKTLSSVYSQMEYMFKNNIIITIKDKGVMYRNNDIKIMPNIGVKAIDKTSADDIFVGAFTYSIAHRFDIEKAIKYSLVAYALSTTRIGSFPSIPTIKEMETVYEQIK